MPHSTPVSRRSFAFGIVAVALSPGLARAAAIESVSQQGPQPSAVVCEKARQIAMNNIIQRCSPPDRPTGKMVLQSEETALTEISPDLWRCDYRIRYECTGQ